MDLHRLIGPLAALVVVAVAVVGGSGQATAQPSEAPCDAWDVEYVLAGRLQLSDTTMGAGNGTYAIGPGTLVLRLYANPDGRPTTRVRMRSYVMRERFPVDAHVAFWTAHVLTDAKTTASPDACAEIASGELEGDTVRWLTPASGYRTDGTVTCEGLCGRFGGPPAGTSELHIPPHAAMFGPFQLARDRKTFRMDASLVSKTESPKHTSRVALSGREVRRTCVRVVPCP